MINGLVKLLEPAARQARTKQRPVLVSSTVPISNLNPMTFFERGGFLAAERRFWAVPERNFFLVGVGEALALTASGDDRFSRIAEQWHDLLDGALLATPTDTGSAGVSSTGRGPLLMGGFAFDPSRPATGLWDGFPHGYMTLPRFQLATVSDTQWLTMNVVVAPDDDPADMAATVEREVIALTNTLPAHDGPLPHPLSVDAPAIEPNGAENFSVSDVDPVGWQAAVAAAASLVREGRLEKVVLAREVLAQADEPIAITGAIASLMERYPSCFVFAVANEDRCFLGASPEQLVQLQGDEVRLMGLAGTARRDAGSQIDRQLGEALLANPKEREEHAVVVRAIKALLAPLCTALAVPDTPTLLRVHNVQHLLTPITGRIIPPHTVLDVVARLHPTPAVGGSPREAALAVIRDLEPFDRGWYTAPVGWVDRHGRGEFTVAIRSALIRGRAASLFAGCGIMGDSDPAAEFEESRYKLRPMLRALSAGVRVGGCR